MCFNKEQKVEAPAAPAETLKQVAPEKKTAATKDSNPLTIGTKKYRNESGLGTKGLNAGAPSGISLSK
ncbi:hypothetical protein [Rhizobium sp. Leaf341]|uniref:hypothetical protein n=1 Tax=Rhizobium sp. Leaf341 TaxID=1736344 RepID=UPI0007150346|nr:hypothetical protein [Rhizobium sp. Leaf341]KQR67877.1 hypothetical protein ASG03_10175 [Rhizobium sp. Leaf341]